MTTEAALELLQNGDPVGALALLHEIASPDQAEPASHAARCQIARNSAPHFARNRDPSWA